MAEDISNGNTIPPKEEIETETINPMAAGIGSMPPKNIAPPTMKPASALKPQRHNEDDVKSRDQGYFNSSSDLTEDKEVRDMTKPPDGYVAMDSPGKARSASPQQGFSTSLDVINLKYIPATDYYYEAKNFMITKFNIQKYFKRNKVFNPTVKVGVLNGVTFRASAGKVHTILSNNPSEQRSLVDLIVGRRKTGEFLGDISLNGLQSSQSGKSSDTTYLQNVAFIPHKTLYIPGLTYFETMRYAARLKLASQNLSSSEIDARVLDIINILDLGHAKTRVIPEFPESRGEIGRDMRLLSIAIEIMALPALVVIDDPVLEIDAGIATKIFRCLYTLAQRGHIIVCSMPKPNPSIVPYIDNVILLSDGYSVYSSSIKNLEKFFCSRGVGYSLRKDVDIMDFVLDIASGTERPESSRVAVTPIMLKELYEQSQFFDSPMPSVDAVSVFSPNFFQLWGYARFDNPLIMMKRTYVIIDRALLSKVKDVETIKRSLGSSIILSCVIGYVQFNQGSYGYYSMTLLRFPYLGTANVTALLFFVNIFVFVQPVLNVHVICQKLQVFRYEQASRNCTSLSFAIATVISDVPFTILYALVFASTCYFLSDLNKGYGNYFFFVVVLCMIANIGLGTALMLSTILIREIPVRDMYFLFTFLMVMLSGFPFQIPHITSYMDQISEINPIRWSFEACMSWKFLDYYHDGYYYLQQFGSQTYDHNHIFETLGNFLIFAWSVFLALLLPFPVLLKKIDEKTREERTRSMSRSRDSPSRESFDKFDAKAPIYRPSELAKPLIFARESSISQKSKLSLSVTPFGEENSTRGPTVTFQGLTYRIKDRRSPLGFKTILSDVCGQFDWGKLAMILGASQSGKSTLLHVLAGDVGVQSDLTGDIFFNGNVVDPQKPLWQRCALVEAHDEQYSDLTVKEVITFAMKLRCITRKDFANVAQNVTSTVEILHLDNILNTKVSQLTRGERRRVSIAEEIVHGPSLLLIDEPTTHLDLLDESVMMMTFREMVNQDKTVVTTSYQPSPASFKLFDTILLLSKGRVIYYGPAANATKHFISCPSNFDFSGYTTNPGDFLIDISSSQIPDYQGNYVEATVLESYYHSTDNFNSMITRLNKLKLKNQSLTGPKGNQPTNAVISPINSTQSAAAVSAGDNSSNGENFIKRSGDEGGESRKESFDVESGIASQNAAINAKPHKKSIFGDSQSSGISTSTMSIICRAMMQFFTWKPNQLNQFFLQCYVIIHRSSLNLLHRRRLFFGSAFFYILLACVFGWIIGDSSDQVYNSASFFAVGPLLVFISNVIFIYYVFRSNEVFLKENSRGLYSNFTHWLVATIPLYCMQIFNSVIYSLIVYKLLNLNTDTDIYRYFFGMSVIAFLASFLMSEFIIYSVSDIRSAYIMIPSLVLVQFAFSGLFIKTLSLPGWLSPWAPSASMIRWCLEGNFINQFQSNGKLFPTVNGFSTYVAFLELFSWEGQSKWLCLYNLLYFMLVFKVGALVSNGLVTLYQQGGRSFKRTNESNNVI